MNYTDFVYGLKHAELPKDVIRKAKLAVLDTLGAILGGLEFPAARIVRNFSAGYHTGPLVATLFGQPAKATVANAIFANATAASALDIDDCQKLCVGHPGAVIVPAALATAEATRASGEELITAVVLGYEIGTRFGALQSPAWNSPVLLAAGRLLNTGAAAASAKLMNFKAESVGHAVGLARLFGPTGHLLDEPSERSIPMSKEAVGWGAMTGAVAAFLAKEGFTGPVCELPLQQENIGPLGEDYTILRSTHKPYPSCRFTHPCIDAVLKLKIKHPTQLRPAEIAAIEVRAFKKALHMNHPHPPNAESAQYSIPYTIAAAVRDNDFWLEHLQEESLADQSLLDLAQKVVLLHDTDCDRTVFDRKMIVTIKTVKGQRLIQEVKHPKGDLENPMRQDELVDKFHRLASIELAAGACRSLSAEILNLEKIHNVSQLLEKVNP
jgi:2-methylcitrate dehydratase PrpD